MLECIYETILAQKYGTFYLTDIDNGDTVYGDIVFFLAFQEVTA